MINPIDKVEKRQIKDRLQKKLQLRQLTLFEALQQEFAIDWFKQSNPAFIALLSIDGMKEMINYIVVPGPEQDKVRSYKVPMIATEILSTPTPKVFELMFTENKQARGGATVGWLIQYFWKGEPNYVISGYVVKILNNLIPGNPHKVLEYMIKNACPRMLGYLSSHSIADFLLRMIIVEDLLLNSYIKERLQIFNQLVEIYIKNKADKEVLENVNYMLCQSFTRLWAQKNKQLGRFSSSLLRMVQVIIDYDDKYQQEKFLPIVVKLLSQHSNISPVIVIVIYKKVFKKLTNLKTKKVKSQNNKNVESFSSLNLYLLETLECIITYFSQQIAKHLQKQNLFTILIDFVTRFQWNSIALVQIQKIIKQSLLKKDLRIYKALIHNLLEAYEKWKLGLQQLNKFGRGYKGFMDSISQLLVQNYTKNLTFKQYLEKDKLLQKFERMFACKEPVIIQNSGFRVVNNIAIPSYSSSSQLCLQHQQFFLETDQINKKYQLQNPADHIKHKQDNQLIHEIENQNMLVYKLLTQHIVGLVQKGGQNNTAEENQKKMEENNSSQQKQ